MEQTQKKGSKAHLMIAHSVTSPSIILRHMLHFSLYRSKLITFLYEENTFWKGPTFFFSQRNFHHLLAIVQISRLAHERTRRPYVQLIKTCEFYD